MLRSELVRCFGLAESDVLPGPGGLVPRIVKALTIEAGDPDVHIHEWLAGKGASGHHGAD